MEEKGSEGNQLKNVPTRFFEKMERKIGCRKYMRSAKMNEGEVGEATAWMATSLTCTTALNFVSYCCQRRNHIFPYLAKLFLLHKL